MNIEIHKTLQQYLKNQEKVTNLDIKEFTKDSVNFSFFTANFSTIYIPIFSEKASVDSRFIDSLNQLRILYPSYEMKLLFYTRKLKIFTYAFSKYNTVFDSLQNL